MWRHEVWNVATNMWDGILVVTIKMSDGGSNSVVSACQPIRYHIPERHNIDVFRQKQNLKSKIKLHLPLNIFNFSSKVWCKWTVKTKEKSYFCTPLGHRGGVQIHLQYCFTSRLEGGEWSALGPGRFRPGEVAVGTFWIGGWLDPRFDRYILKKIIIPRPSCSESRRPAVSIVTLAI